MSDAVCARFMPCTCQVVAVLGVGGGALPLTLHAQFPSMTVDAVELSSGVAAAAQAHFGLTPDERLTLHVGDGAAFVEGAPAGRYDVVMVDVAGSRGYSDVRSPPLMV
jgi:spermidine synthase